MDQESLFADTAKYAIDTNVLVSFLGDGDSEHYPIDVFKPQWDFLELAMRDGRVVAPAIVATELEKWSTTIPAVRAWLHDHKWLFHDITTDQELAIAKRIVNTYTAYATSLNYLGDLEVMSFAHARRLTVLSLEVRSAQHSARKPKIPNVCEEFGVKWVNLAGFLRAERFA